MNWGMIPGWEETIWSIEIMDPGLVSEIFLIDPHNNLSLVLHGLLWDLPNSQSAQGGIFLTFLRLLGIFILLNNTRRNFKEQWFSLWHKTWISLSPCPRRYAVDHRLTMYSLIRLASEKSFSTSSKLVGIWDGLLVRVSRSSTASRLSSWTKIRISMCLPRRPPWCDPLGQKIWVGITLYGISRCLLGIGAPLDPPLWAREVLKEYQNRVMRSVPRYVFRLGVRVPRWSTRK